MRKAISAHERPTILRYLSRCPRPKNYIDYRTRAQGCQLGNYFFLLLDRVFCPENAHRAIFFGFPNKNVTCEGHFTPMGRHFPSTLSVTLYGRVGQKCWFRVRRFTVQGWWLAKLVFSINCEPGTVNPEPLKRNASLR